MIAAVIDQRIVQAAKSRAGIDRDILELECFQQIDDDIRSPLSPRFLDFLLLGHGFSSQSPCSEKPTRATSTITVLFLGNLHPPLDRRPLGNLVVPAFHVGKFLQLHVMAVVAPNPWLAVDVSE